MDRWPSTVRVAKTEKLEEEWEGSEIKGQGKVRGQRSGWKAMDYKLHMSVSLPFASRSNLKFAINLPRLALLIHVDFPCTPVPVSDENVLWNHSILSVITMAIRHAR